MKIKKALKTILNMLDYDARAGKERYMNIKQDTGSLVSTSTTMSSKLGDIQATLTEGNNYMIDKIDAMYQSLSVTNNLVDQMYREMAGTDLRDLVREGFERFNKESVQLANGQSLYMYVYNIMKFKDIPVGVIFLHGNFLWYKHCYSNALHIRNVNSDYTAKEQQEFTLKKYLIEPANMSDIECVVLSINSRINTKKEQSDALSENK